MKCVMLVCWSAMVWRSRTHCLLPMHHVPLVACRGSQRRAMASENESKGNHFNAIFSQALLPEKSTVFDLERIDSALFARSRELGVDLVN